LCAKVGETKIEDVCIEKEERESRYVSWEVGGGGARN
tara:strand:+ start:703 stop:813 length:111 start_codon:yes stop_codon:yes gene_type:complete